VPTLRRRALLLAPAFMTMAAEADRTGSWLAAWDGQDIHRTATPGDAAGAAWLAAEARALGAAVEIETFPLNRLDPVAAFVELEGTRYPGVTMFDAPDTPDGRVHALVNLLGTGEGLVALAEFSPLAVYSPDFATMRRTAKHWVLVLVTRGGAPGLALLNAESFGAPYGAAILQVSSEYRDILFGAAGRGAAMRVVTRSTRVAAASCAGSNACARSWRSGRYATWFSPPIPATNWAISASTPSSRGGKAG
jgi:hypothetical protein